MYYLLVRTRYGLKDRHDQEALVERFRKSKRIGQSVVISQETSDSEHQRLNAELKKALKKGDKLVISRLSVLGPSFTMVVEIIGHLVKNGIVIHSVTEKIAIPSGNINRRSLIEAFKISRNVEDSILKDRAARGLTKRKATGLLGRPKGTISGKTKLSGKEEEIRKLLHKKVSVSAIARIHNVNRITVNKFIERHSIRS